MATRWSFEIKCVLRKIIYVKKHNLIYQIGFRLELIAKIIGVILFVVMHSSTSVNYKDEDPHKWLNPPHFASLLDQSSMALRCARCFKCWAVRNDKRQIFPLQLHHIFCTPAICVHACAKHAPGLSNVIIWKPFLSFSWKFLCLSDNAHFGWHHTKASCRKQTEAQMKLNPYCSHTRCYQLMLVDGQSCGLSLARADMKVCFHGPQPASQSFGYCLMFVLESLAALCESTDR